MTEGATSAPVASKFAFLHEVPSLPSGTKVRLLGCIVQYDTAKGQILLEHAYPREAIPVPRIWVDVTLVLESTKTTTLAQGTWINIIGYIQTASRQTRRQSETQILSAPKIASLQAVLIWDGGAVRIDEYEYALEEQRRVRRQLQSKTT